MGARTGQEYVERLAQTRPTIDINGERVAVPVPEHPALASIVRSYERLKRAVADMRELGSRLTKYYHEATISKSIVELFHGQQMASIVAESALRNPVSRGAHFRRD